MDKTIEYGPIAPNRWEDYRDLWLEALKKPAKYVPNVKTVN
jgi:hypothetical protein